MEIDRRIEDNLVAFDPALIEPLEEAHSRAIDLIQEIFQEFGVSTDLNSLDKETIDRLNAELWIS